MTSLQLLIYEDQSNADVTKKNFITVEKNNKKQIQKFVKFQKNLNIQLIKKKMIMTVMKTAEITILLMVNNFD